MVRFLSPLIRLIIFIFRLILSLIVTPTNRVDDKNKLYC